MPPNGVPIPIPKDKFTKRCGHIHISGRRCGNRYAKKDIYGKTMSRCKVHLEADRCQECVSMQQAFPIRKELPL